MTAELAAMLKGRAVVHLANWGPSRAEVVPVCTGRPARWTARWCGPDAHDVAVTCKHCRAALDAGRVRWTD